MVSVYIDSIRMQVFFHLSESRPAEVADDALGLEVDRAHVVVQLGPGEGRH